MIEQALRHLIDKKKLENQYGWQSCFDVPDKYDEMDEHGIKATEIVKEETEGTKIFKDDLHDVLETVASEIAWGNISEDATAHLVTQDDFIEIYVLGQASDETRKLFDSLFYFMSSDERGQWLRSNHIDHDPSMWADDRTTFVIQVDE